MTMTKKVNPNDEYVMSNARNYDNLFDAAANDDVHDIEALIKEGHDVHTRDECGATPLHHGCLNCESFFTIRPLLKAGAEVDARDNDGITPLMVAANTAKAVNVLWTLRNFNADFNAHDIKNGLTPLHYAIASKSPDIVNIVKFVLECGADVNAKSNNGLTPLKMVEREDVKPEVRTLVRSYATKKLDIQA